MLEIALWVWQEWTYVVLVLMAIFVLMFFPLAVTQTTLVLRWLVRLRCKPRAAPNPQAGRRVAVVVCTNGKAVESVEYIVKTTMEYAVPGVSCWVLKEGSDPHQYAGADEIVIPVGYSTPNGSWTKERALHYFAEWSRERGWSKETYVVHLDDDSLVTKDYLLYVLGMTFPVGQGSIRLREYGHHKLSTLADLVRVSDCETWCHFFNERSSPKAVHGEGLTVRADVEQEIGWDYQTYCGEDFLFGHLAVSKGYAFEHIPHEIYIAPPTNTMDFLKQRRRWTVGILGVARQMMKIAPLSYLWVVYRYAVGWTGFLGFFLFVYAAIVRVYLPPWLTVVGVFNLVTYFGYYQMGAWMTHRKLSPQVAALQFVIAIYEGMALPYTVLFPPDKHSFETISKPVGGRP